METHYRDSDFLQDDKFIEWRLCRTEESELFWTQFLEQHPESAEAINRAILKFEAVKLHNNTLSEEEEYRLLQRVMNNARHEYSRKRLILYRTVAACALVLLFSTVVYIYNRYTDNKSKGPSEEVFIGQVMPSDEIKLIAGEKITTLNQDAQITLKENGIAAVTDESHTSELALAKKKR